VPGAANRFEVAAPVHFKGLGQIGVLRVEISTEKVEALARGAAWAILGVGASALVLGMAIYSSATRRVTRRLAAVVAVAEAVAEGDLRPTPVPGGRDELGRLEGALAQMIQGLRGVVLRVAKAADEVAQASGHVTSASGESAKESDAAAEAIDTVSATLREMEASIASTARHAQDQMAFVTQTSGSIQEMAASLRRVSEGVSKLIDLAQRSSETAATGQGAVRRASSSLEEIGRTIHASAGSVRALGAKARDSTKSWR
jgi:methyl-accepting chemotaxis protein